MTTSAQNSQSESDKLPKVAGEGTATHVSGAGEAITDSGSRKSEPSASKAILFELGRRIRDYELLELLGQGGMGSVWKAKHTRLKKFVAVKLLPQEKTSDAAAVARFNREMEAVGQLRHPHIIEAHDAGEENGTHYLVMDYVEGVELAALSKKVGQFPIADGCELMRQTALGLQHAFEHGLVHRDIKPSNLLLSTDDPHGSRTRESSDPNARTLTSSATASSATNCTLKILDLGLALLLGDQPAEELTSTGQVMGTLDYIAPEQLADTHAVDIRADLYSLGCTLFRLLTTEPPFAGPTLNTAAKKMFAHSFTPAPKLLDRRPDVPAELSSLVARLLEKKPDARFATPLEVAVALAPFCVGHNLPALLASSAPPSPASDPFASTVLPHQHDAPASGRSPMKHDAPASGPLAHDAPTIGLLSQPIVAQSVAQSATEHNHSLARRAKSVTERRLLLAAAVLAVVVLLGIIIKIKHKDGTVTEIKVPNDATIEITDDSRMGTPARPAFPNNATNKKQGQTTAEGNTKIRTGKSAHPTDPDRVAAEWVLSRKAEHVTVHIENPKDGSLHSVTKAAELPAGPIRLVHFQCVNADGVDAASLERHLVPLKSLRSVRIENCSQVSDTAIPVLQRLSSVTNFAFGGSGITAQGVLTLVKSRPLVMLAIDGRQFSAGLADLLVETPSLNDFAITDCTDEQIRQVLRAKHLDSLAVVFTQGTKSDLRHSTWARLADELPNLRAFLLDQPRFNDADLAAIARLPKLEELTLIRMPNITDVGLAQLAACSQLKWIDIHNSNVTPVGIASLQEALPQCQVQWDGTDHRAVAEWVLSVGGKVQVAGRGAAWLVPEVVRLPKSTPGSEPELSRVRLPGTVLLTGVDLSGLQTVKDADLARLADCTSLRELRFDNSSLTGACLSHLRHLTRLRFLKLNGPPIQDDELVSLREFRQLEHVGISQTKISDAGLRHLVGLTELEILSFGSTRVTTAGLETLKPLPKLLALDLGNTNADDRTAELLFEFPALRFVYLSNTQVTAAGVRRLAQRKLPWNRLRFEGMPLTDAILADLREQKELVALDVSNTQVTPEAFDAFVRAHPRLGMTRATDESEAPDHRVARRVLEAGGEIVIVGPIGVTRIATAVNIQDFPTRTIRKLADLPAEPYRITVIDCRENTAVTDATLAEVGGLQVLHSIQIDKTSVTEAVVEEIVRTPNLSELILDFSPISSAAIAKLTTMPSLQQLELHATKLDGASIKRLGQLTNLVRLDIGSNPLTDDDVTFLEQLPNLEELGIGTTNISSHGWQTIAKLPKLKRLSADTQPVADEALRHIRGHATLQYLNVAGSASQVSDEGLRHVATLRSLRELNASYCPSISDAGLAVLADLPALETLHLNATPITDAGLPHLHQLKSLKSLNLTDCKLSAPAIDDLQDALPWCRIQRPKFP